MAILSSQSSFLSESYVKSLFSHLGSLFGVTIPNAYLVRWNGVDEWQQVAESSAWNDPFGNGPWPGKALATLGSDLYYGHSRSGNLLKWNGSDAFTSVAAICSSFVNIHNLLNINNELIGLASASSTYGAGAMVRWNGSDSWELASQEFAVYVGKPYQSCIRDGILYVISVYGELYSWDGSGTLTLLTSSLVNTPSVMIVHENELYVHDSLYLYKWDEISSFNKLTNTVAQLSPRSLFSSPDGIFAGASSGGGILRFNGVDDWEAYDTDNLGGVDVLDFVVHNGKVYCSGNIGLYETDITPSFENDALPPVELSGVPTRGKAPLSVRFTPTTALGQ